jgi:hypothetical protein
MPTKAFTAISIALVLVILAGRELFDYWTVPASVIEFKPTLPPPQNAAEALALLTPEQHISDPYIYFQGDRREVSKRLPIYMRQISALQYLRANKAPSAIPCLILYLDYGTSESDMLFSQLSPGPDEEGLKTIYPAFGALLEMPEAKGMLDAYALNQKNPVAYRVACVEVIGYIDTTTYDKTWSVLKDQIKDPKIQDYLGYLKEGRAGFCGVPVF